jgi:cobalamin-dependent methionine synthase I
MKIIGEKINGTLAPVAKAIEERDAGFIQRLAVRQAEAGSSWLDVNAGTSPEREPDDMTWLVETIQAVVSIPLALDSPNPDALEAGARVVRLAPMINSISGDAQRMGRILPLVTRYGCEVIALAMDERKIPETCEERLEVIERILAATRGAGVQDERVYIDTLAMTVATAALSAVTACETIRMAKGRYPQVHFTLGLSNISFGLPARRQINRCFLVMAMQAGMDCAILDPLDRGLRAAIVTAELLLGEDRNCRGYLRAAREGMFKW